MLQSHKGSRACFLEHHVLSVIFLGPPGRLLLDTGHLRRAGGCDQRWNPRNLSRQRPSKQASGFSTHRSAGCRL